MEKLDPLYIISLLKEARCLNQELNDHYIDFDIQKGDQKNKTFSFIKNHSYGEYIFDWSWAEAYHRAGISYYPKLTSMIPYTPVSCPHFLMNNWSLSQAKELLEGHDNHYLSHPFSSAHFLYLLDHEKQVFEGSNYLIRQSIQYHFKNRSYRDFKDFLDSLKTKKAKTIKKERSFSNLDIQTFTKNQLTAEMAKRMHQFYQLTIRKKNAIPYLNAGFFSLLFEKLKNNTLYIEATNSQTQQPIAGSLFLYDKHNLYGRYWGATEQHKNLHFELCYYQGIDFCIKYKLSTFEAGAQGEHKIPRGFEPTWITSAHHIKNEQFRLAIKSYINQESQYYRELKKELSKNLPFS